MTTTSDGSHLGFMTRAFFDTIDPDILATKTDSGMQILSVKELSVAVVKEPDIERAASELALEMRKKNALCGILFFTFSDAVSQLSHKTIRGLAEKHIGIATAKTSDPSADLKTMLADFQKNRAFMLETLAL